LQAARDDQTDDEFPLAVVLAITMSTIALILLIIMLIVLARRRKSAKMVVTPMSLQDRREPMFPDPIYIVPETTSTKV
jgi:heme/copper-type cytochrome/quinol oxidase subunit 2